MSKVSTASHPWGVHPAWRHIRECIQHSVTSVRSASWWPEWRASPCFRPFPLKTGAHHSNVVEFWDHLDRRKNFISGAFWLIDVFTTDLRSRVEDEQRHLWDNGQRDKMLRLGAETLIQSIRSPVGLSLHIHYRPQWRDYRILQIILPQRTGSTVPDKHFCPLVLIFLLCFVLFFNIILGLKLTI